MTPLQELEALIKNDPQEIMDLKATMAMRLSRADDRAIVIMATMIGFLYAYGQDSNTKNILAEDILRTIKSKVKKECDCPECSGRRVMGNETMH